jgi:hypothetical protein
VCLTRTTKTTKNNKLRTIASIANEANFSVLILYTSDYTAQKQFPREYTLFSKLYNKYVTYLIAKIITPKELGYILDLYVETCGNYVKFNHKSIKI